MDLWLVISSVVVPLVLPLDLAFEDAGWWFCYIDMVLLVI